MFALQGVGLLHDPAPMILAGILDISINLLLVFQVIICLLLSLVVLMQRPKNEGLGAAFGSGMTDSVWGAQTTDVLQKGTVWFGTLFFVVTLILSILIGHQNANPNLAEGIETAPALLAPAEVEEDTATTEEGADLADAMKKAEELAKEATPEVNGEAAPEAPATEDAPVVPVEEAPEVPVDTPAEEPAKTE